MAFYLKHFNSQIVTLFCNKIKFITPAIIDISFVVTCSIVRVLKLDTSDWIAVKNKKSYDNR